MTGATYRLVILDIPRDLFNEDSPQGDAFRDTLINIKSNSVCISLVVPTGTNPHEIVLLGYFDESLTVYGRCHLIPSILLDSQSKGRGITDNELLYLCADQDHFNEVIQNFFADVVHVGSGFDGLNNALARAFGEDVVVRAEPKPTAKFPKAIVFDVQDTLTTKDCCQHYPRTETLVGTLQNIEQRGVLLFAVSYMADSLTSYGFPEGLITPIVDGDKDKGIRRVLSETGFHPFEMLAFGDDSIDEYAAHRNKVPFVKLSLEDKIQLENELVCVFGANILGKPPVKKELICGVEQLSKKGPTTLTSNPVSDLPVPKPPEPKKRPGFFRRLFARNR